MVDKLQLLEFLANREARNPGGSLYSARPWGLRGHSAAQPLFRHGRRLRSRTALHQRHNGSGSGVSSLDLGAGKRSADARCVGRGGRLVFIVGLASVEQADVSGRRVVRKERDRVHRARWSSQRVVHRSNCTYQSRMLCGRLFAVIARLQSPCCSRQLMRTGERCVGLAERWVER